MKHFLVVPFLAAFSIFFVENAFSKEVECRIKNEVVVADDGREVNVCTLSKGFGGIAFECEKGFGEHLWKSYSAQCELNVLMDNNVPIETCKAIGAWYNPEKHSCEYVIASKQ